MAYDKGQRIRVQSTFEVDNVLTTPAVAVLTVKEPDGNVTTYDIAGGGLTELSTGILYRDVTLDQAGTYIFNMRSSSGVIAAAENAAHVVETEAV